jgi:hypothetical protein
MSMASGESVRPEIKGGAAGGEALREVIEVARTAVAQEFEIAERLGNKARSQVTLAGQWFAVVQAVSGIAYVKSVHGWKLFAVGGLAVAGGIALVVTFALAREVWKRREHQEVSPRGLIDMGEQAKRLDDVEFLERIIVHLASVLQSQRAANKERNDALDRAEKAWFVAMALPLAQLGFALAARLFV